MGTKPVKLRDPYVNLSPTPRENMDKVELCSQALKDELAALEKFLAKTQTDVQQNNRRQREYAFRLRDLARDGQPTTEFAQALSSCRQAAVALARLMARIMVVMRQVEEIYMKSAPAVFVSDQCNEFLNELSMLDRLYNEIQHLNPSMYSPIRANAITAAQEAALVAEVSTQLVDEDDAFIARDPRSLERSRSLLKS